MSYTRITAFLCVCAIVANVWAEPAPPPSIRNMDKEANLRGVVHEAENSIIVKKIPIAYFYPFSLWPLPKAFPTTKDLKELEEQERSLEMLPGQEPKKGQKRRRNRHNQERNKR